MSSGVHDHTPNPCYMSVLNFKIREYSSMGQDIDTAINFTSLHCSILYYSLAFPLSCRAGKSYARIWKVLYDIETFAVRMIMTTTMGIVCMNAISFLYNPCRSPSVNGLMLWPVPVDHPSIHSCVVLGLYHHDDNHIHIRLSFFLNRDRETQEQWMSVQHRIVLVMVVIMTLFPSLHSPLLCCFLSFFVVLFAYISSISFMMKMIVWYITQRQRNARCVVFATLLLPWRTGAVFFLVCLPCPWRRMPLCWVQRRKREGSSPSFWIGAGHCIIAGASASYGVLLSVSSATRWIWLLRRGGKDAKRRWVVYVSFNFYASMLVMMLVRLARHWAGPHLLNNED